MSQGTGDMISTAGGVELGTAELALDTLRAQLEPMKPPQCLQWAMDRFGAGFAMTTSFGIQSSVLLHMLSRLPGAKSVPVIWVDTGYLPAETYRYASALCARLGTRLVVAQSVMSPARMEAVHGRLWESGREQDLDLYLRLRKVEPLEQEEPLQPLYQEEPL